MVLELDKSFNVNLVDLDSGVHMKLIKIRSRLNNDFMSIFNICNNTQYTQYSQYRG